MSYKYFMEATLLFICLIMSQETNSSETNELDEQPSSFDDAKFTESPPMSVSATRKARVNLTMLSYAASHLKKMKDKHGCRNPRPRLVQVKKIYPSTSNTYMPRCVFLHKCDDESGCCSSEDQQCVPKKQTTVQFYFYVMNLKGLVNVELLEFMNDTICECRKINSRPRVEEELPYLPRDPDNNNGDENLPSETSNKKETLCEKIRCPNPFHSRPVTTQAPHSCKCDCLFEDKKCLRIKHGFDRLESLEKRCVQTEECMEPSCQYGHFGSFDRRKGKCPGKEHRIHSKYKHRHHRHSFRKE